MYRPKPERVRDKSRTPEAKRITIQRKQQRQLRQKGA